MASSRTGGIGFPASVRQSEHCKAKILRRKNRRGKKWVGTFWGQEMLAKLFDLGTATAERLLERTIATECTDGNGTNDSQQEERDDPVDETKRDQRFVCRAVLD